MIALLKEGWILANLSYYQTALNHMGASHDDCPAVFIHVAHLRDQLNAMRGKWSTK